MNRVVYDIETAGIEFQKLDGKQQEYFLKWANSPEEEKSVKLETALSALTGQIVSIATLSYDRDHAIVFTVGEYKNVTEDDAEFLFYPSEGQVLEQFWDHARHFQQFITFNGRTFDAPYVLLRSAINKVKPTIDILGYRYKQIPHLDLADQMSFFGATRRRFPLHFYCKAFGIESPKDGEMNGLDVPTYFQTGRYMDIARYCLGDVRATAQLLRYWDEFLDPATIGA